MEEHSTAGEVKGVVLHEQLNGKFEPLVNASVYWLGTKKGVLSDVMGVFAITPNATTNRLIVSYVGYTSDTLTILDNKDLILLLFGLCLSLQLLQLHLSLELRHEMLQYQILQVYFLLLMLLDRV
mgnify:CR=1 FL=1